MIKSIEALWLAAGLCLVPVITLQAAEYPAQLQWAGVHEVSVPVEAVVETLAVEAGERVQKGQLLLQLHAEPFDYRRQRAQAEVDALLPQLEDARREKDDARALYEQTVLSDVELQAAEIRYRSLQAGLRQARAGLKLAQWEAGWTRLRASRDAVVIEVNARPGQVIAGDVRSRPLLLLADAGSMLASAALPLATAMTLQLGDSITLRIGEHEYPARVQSVAMQADAGGKVTVYALFQSRQRYIAGMSAILVLP